jgi:hypothetical protein
MVWIERALQLLFSLSAYAVYFKLHGLWEKKLESWISPRLARDITLWVGRIEASRVFRRLLFVRRSYDERYEEQVFA